MVQGERMMENDIVWEITHLKQNYAGHVVRTADSGYNNQIISWSSFEGRRVTMRPKIRWYDDIKSAAGLNQTAAGQKIELEEQNIIRALQLIKKK